MKQTQLSEIEINVKDCLAKIKETGMYSVSQIYGLYNQAFNKNETPQSCSSCLQRKAAELQKWLDLQEQNRLQEQQTAAAAIVAQQIKKISKKKKDTNDDTTEQTDQ